MLLVVVVREREDKLASNLYLPSSTRVEPGQSQCDDGFASDVDQHRSRTSITSIISECCSSDQHVATKALV